jgi:hypothetical protein
MAGGSFAYAMEYMPFPTLAELIVYGNQSVDFWRNISKKLIVLLTTMNESTAGDIEVQDGLFLEKTRERCANLQPEYAAQVNEMLTWIEPRSRGKPSIMHGDLCFSNILYDRRSDSLKIIDPRGYSRPNGVHGSQLYDLAKLYHSAFGCYDFAVADVAPNFAAREKCRIVCDDIIMYAAKKLRASEAELTCVTALLFYSMFPLHTDDMERVSRLLGSGIVCWMRWKELTNGTTPDAVDDQCSERGDGPTDHGATLRSSVERFDWHVKGVQASNKQ